MMMMMTMMMMAKFILLANVAAVGRLRDIVGGTYRFIINNDYYVDAHVLSRTPSR